MTFIEAVRSAAPDQFISRPGRKSQAWAINDKMFLERYRMGGVAWAYTREKVGLNPDDYEANDWFVFTPSMTHDNITK